MGDNIAKKILKVVQDLALEQATTRRIIERIDERLVDVEKQVSNIKEHTALIPGIAEAVANNSIDLDNHEKRLKKLEAA